MAESIVTDQTVYQAGWTSVRKLTKRTTRTPVSNYVDRVEYIEEDGQHVARGIERSTLAEAKAVVRQRLQEEIAQAEAHIVEAQADIEGYRKNLAALEAMTE